MSKDRDDKRKKPKKNKQKHAIMDVVAELKGLNEVANASVDAVDAEEANRKARAEEVRTRLSEELARANSVAPRSARKRKVSSEPMPDGLGIDDLWQIARDARDAYEAARARATEESAGARARMAEIEKREVACDTREADCHTRENELARALEKLRDMRRELDDQQADLEARELELSERERSVLAQAIAIQQADMEALEAQCDRSTTQLERYGKVIVARQQQLEAMRQQLFEQAHEWQARARAIFDATMQRFTSQIESERASITDRQRQQESLLSEIASEFNVLSDRMAAEAESIDHLRATLDAREMRQEEERQNRRALLAEAWQAERGSIADADDEPFDDDDDVDEELSADVDSDESPQVEAPVATVDEASESGLEESSDADQEAAPVVAPAAPVVERIRFPRLHPEGARIVGRKSGTTSA